MVVIGEGESREMEVVMLTKTLYIGSARFEAWNDIVI